MFLLLNLFIAHKEAALRLKPVVQVWVVSVVVIILLRFVALTRSIVVQTITTVTKLLVSACTITLLYRIRENLWTLKKLKMLLRIYHKIVALKELAQPLTLVVTLEVDNLDVVLTLMRLVVVIMLIVAQVDINVISRKDNVINKHHFISIFASP